MAQIVELQSPERPGEEVLPSDVPTEDQLPDEASQEKSLKELSDEEFQKIQDGSRDSLIEAKVNYDKTKIGRAKGGLKDKILRSISRGRRRGKEDREDGDYEKDPEKIYVEAMDRYRDLLVERKRRLVEKIELKLDRLGEDDKGKVTELIEEMETDMISALENVNNEEDPNKRFNRLTSINDVNRRVASNELIKRILKPKVEKEGTANVPAESAADTPAAEQEGVLQSDVSTEDQLPDEAKQETKKPLQELSDEELKTAEDEVSEEIEKIRKGLKETETSSEEIRGINEKYVQSMNSHRDILEEKWRRLFIEYESDTEIVESGMYEGMNARLQRIINQYNQENDPNEKYYHLGDYDKTLELYRQKIINTVIVRERNIKREKEERERKKRRWF